VSGEAAEVNGSGGLGAGLGDLGGLFDAEPA
jgi:hypothetical protein